MSKLQAFFQGVAKLTLDHDVATVVIDDRDLCDVAVVYPSKLGPLLEAVDPDWYKLQPPPDDNELRKLLAEARKIIRASSARATSKDWDERATAALAKT